MILQSRHRASLRSDERAGVVILALVLAAAPLHLWHSYRGAELEALSAITRTESARLGIEVELTQVPFDNLQSKLLQALSAGQGPGLFILRRTSARASGNAISRVVARRSAIIVAAQDALRFGDDARFIGYPFSAQNARARAPALVARCPTRSPRSI